MTVGLSQVHLNHFSISIDSYLSLDDSDAIVYGRNSDN